MVCSVSGESICTSVQLEKRKIHTGFLRFSNFHLCQYLLPSALADLTKDSLGFAPQKGLHFPASPVFPKSPEKQDLYDTSWMIQRYSARDRSEHRRKSQSNRRLRFDLLPSVYSVTNVEEQVHRVLLRKVVVSRGITPLHMLLIGICLRFCDKK